MTAQRLFLQLRKAPFLGIWLIAFLVRLAVLIRFSQSPDFVPNGDDMKFYHDWAIRIMNGQWTDGHAFYGLPGYAYASAAIFYVFGDHPMPLGVLQCGFDALTAAFIARIGTHVFSGGADRDRALGIGLTAALAWVFFQPAQTFSIILMPTSWVIAAFWGLVLWLATMKGNPRWWTWLAIGGMAGVVSTIVATILLLLPLVVVAIGLRAGEGLATGSRMRAALTALVLLFAGVFTGCAPAWIHNYFIAHEPVLLSAHSGLNYWIGNNPVAIGYPKIPPGLRASQEGLLRDSITLAQRESGKPLTRAEVSAYWSAKAKSWIAENRGKWWALMGRKFSNFWNAFQYDDLSIISLLKSQEVLPPGIRFGVVAALGLPGLLLTFVRVPRARWVVAAGCLHLAALMPVFITERYRLCAVPGLLLCGSYLLWEMWRWLVSRQWLPAIGVAGATAASVVFVTWPQGDIGLWSLDHFNTGLRAFKTNDMETARRELDLAYAYVQTNAEINFALGNLWLAQGDRTKAKAFYRRTIELEPRHANAWNNLGFLALQEKLWPFAVRCLGLAVEYEPEDVKAHYLLARALQGKGDIEPARSALKYALAQEPQRPEFLALRAELDSAVPE